MISDAEAKILHVAKTHYGVLYAGLNETIESLLMLGLLSAGEGLKFWITPAGQNALKEWEANHE
jgi:hypothetical protein